MPKKKIPGQIRFTPELDCISLERVRQDFGFPSGHKFSQHHRTAGFFQTGYGGPVKVYWFGSCTKKMGQVKRDRCTNGRHLYFSSSILYFLYLCIFVFLKTCCFLWQTKKIMQVHFGGRHFWPLLASSLQECPSPCLSDPCKIFH